MKQNLNEQIARIKQLLVIKESSDVKETETILNEQFFAKLLQKMGSAFETKFITSVEGKLGKKIATATDAEIGAALKSLPVLRQEIAAAVYTTEKSMIDGVFSKYDMSIAGEASAAYTELQVKGLNKGILKYDQYFFRKALPIPSIPPAEFFFDSLTLLSNSANVISDSSDSF